MALVFRRSASVCTADLLRGRYDPCADLPAQLSTRRRVLADPAGPDSSGDAVVVLLAHEPLDVSAEEADVAAEFDPPQDAGAPPVQDGGDGDREQGGDLGGLHDVVAGQSAGGVVGSERCHGSATEPDVAPEFACADRALADPFRLSRGAFARELLVQLALA